MTGTKYSAEAVNMNNMVGERSARSDATMKMLVDSAEVRMSA